MSNGLSVAREYVRFPLAKALVRSRRKSTLAVILHSTLQGNTAAWRSQIRSHTEARFEARYRRWEADVIERLPNRGRGCGLPETLIEYFPSLVHQPIQFYSCFISYSTRDEEFVERLYADLQVKGVRCWYAPEDLKIGDRFRQRIDDAIRLHDKLLIVLSENSVRSAWVREEVESCLEREQREGRLVLFPIRLDDAVMQTSEAWAASIRRQRHIGEFQDWKDHDAYQSGFKRLLRDLKPENPNT
jgi:hypothetical protein